MKQGSRNRYKALIEKVFFDRYQAMDQAVYFEREDIVSAAMEIGVALPKTLGDVVYSVRYRNPMPESILDLQPEGMEWIIEGTGRSKYVFRLVRLNRVVPNRGRRLIVVKIPDSTPEIVKKYALSDEQALLAIVRYTRLIDIFDRSCSVFHAKPFKNHCIIHWASGDR